MSASVLGFNRDDAFAAGCDDFLPKPFRESELIDKLGRALGLAWVQAEAAAVPSAGAVPSPGELAPLLAAVRRGEIAAVRTLLGELRARRPECAEFVARADLLARDFQMENLRALLEHSRAGATA
jgi:CheY-like chemotaxis protein